jgi:heat shock protein HtpX
MMPQRTDFYHEITANKFKSFLLMFVFVAVVILVGYAIGYATGNAVGGLAFALILSIIMSFASYYWSDKIVLMISNARPVTREEFPQLYDVVEEMSIASGLPMPRVYVMDEDAPNAFATGRNPQHAVVCATTGLLRLMNRDELQGVIAHEMSHVQNYDVLFQTIAVVLAGTVIILGYMLRMRLFYGGRSRGGRDNGVQSLVLLLGLLLAILAPIFTMMLRMAISRRREYLADASGAKLTRYPEGLASALQKLGAYSKPVQTANNATAPLFIVNPFNARSIGNLFSTHPPIEERVKRLRAMDIVPEPEPGQKTQQIGKHTYRK